MDKIRLAVIFGGMSTENEVSCASAKSVISNLDKNKYDIKVIFINKDGEWFELEDINKIEEKTKIENIITCMENIDVVFPVLHGLYGEDGTIQGWFELLKKSYVGCKVLSSAVGMDKVYTKIIFEKAKINQTPYIYLRKDKKKYILFDEEFNEKQMELKQICDKISNKLIFPMFVKPSNSGSSVGITKVHNILELEKGIKIASEFDNKILVEQGINGREVECAVLGNEEVISSCVGEIKAADEFYSYDAKYNNVESKTIIPADISPDKEKEIKELAVKAFRAIDGRGLSRVDFFIENNTNKVFINEINTMPGFTNISMYPKLFEAVGIKYSKLLDKLIDLALER